MHAWRHEAYAAGNGSEAFDRQRCRCPPAGRQTERTETPPLLLLLLLGAVQQSGTMRQLRSCSPVYACIAAPTLVSTVQAPPPRPQIQRERARHVQKEDAHGSAT